MLPGASAGSLLQAKLDAFNAAATAAVATETVVRGHHATKDDALDGLADCMKADLRYAEFAARDHADPAVPTACSQRS
jgi:hypothetical protein